MYSQSLAWLCCYIISGVFPVIVRFVKRDNSAIKVGVIN